MAENYTAAMRETLFRELLAVCKDYGATNSDTEAKLQEAVETVSFEEPPPPKRYVLGDVGAGATVVQGENIRFGR